MNLTTSFKMMTLSDSESDKVIVGLKKLLISNTNDWEHRIKNRVSTPKTKKFKVSPIFKNKIFERSRLEQETRLKKFQEQKRLEQEERTAIAEYSDGDYEELDAQEEIEKEENNRVADEVIAELGDMNWYFEQDDPYWLQQKKWVSNQINKYEDF